MNKCVFIELTSASSDQRVSSDKKSIHISKALKIMLFDCIDKKKHRRVKC